MQNIGLMLNKTQNWLHIHPNSLNGEFFTAKRPTREKAHANRSHPRKDSREITHPRNDPREKTHPRIDSVAKVFFSEKTRHRFIHIFMTDCIAYKLEYVIHDL